jgi:hypothetical protein
MGLLFFHFLKGDCYLLAILAMTEKWKIMIRLHVLADVCRSVRKPIK